MSDDDRIIQVIAEALRAGSYDFWHETQSLGCDTRGEKECAYLAPKLLAALRRSNIEPVELPRPDEWNSTSWRDGSVRLADNSSDRKYIVIENVPGETILVDIGYAREFAAALLAAARKAQEGT